MDVRPYSSDDLPGCLTAFDSNVPEYFDPSERAEFTEFLAEDPWPYVVMENEGASLGCGGWDLEDGGKLASLTWGLVRNDLHKQGLGRFLLLYRLREVAKISGVERVRIDTSQQTAEFFRKQGFKVLSVEKDGYAPGLDRIEMMMKLAVCP